MNDFAKVTEGEGLSENMSPEFYAETLKNKSIKDLKAFLEGLNSQPFPAESEVNILCFRDLYARAIEPLSERTRQYELKAFLEHRFIQPYLFKGGSSSMVGIDTAHPAYELFGIGGFDFIFLEMTDLIKAEADKLLTTKEIEFTQANRSLRLLTGKEIAAFIWTEIVRVCKFRKSA